MAGHYLGIVPHDRLSLHMEIPHHLVSPPRANEADDISIHTGTEDFHGACRPKGLRRDIFMHESQIGSREKFDCGLEVGRDHSGDHIFPTAPRRIKTGTRGVCGSDMLL